MALSRIKTGGIEDGTIQDVDVNDIAVGKITGAVTSWNLTGEIPSAHLNATNLGTGTVPDARLNIGTSAGQLIQLDGSGRLPAVDGSLLSNVGLAYAESVVVPTAGQQTFNINYTVGKIQIFLNGVKLIVGTDVTATTGTTVVFPASPALTTNDTVSLCTF